MFYINLMGRIKQLEKLVGKHIDTHMYIYARAHTHAHTCICFRVHLKDWLFYLMGLYVNYKHNL